MLSVAKATIVSILLCYVTLHPPSLVSLTIMSQLSQFSDAYASSLYDANNPDSLQVIQLDDLTSNLSFSQQASQSVADSDFTRLPIPAPLIPSSLERVCPDRISAYLVYSDMTKEDVVNWWLQTDFGQKKRMRWDARQQSDVWKHFDQVAKAKDGAPKVMCKRCKKVLDHPQQHGNGTTAMIKHLKGIGCRAGNRPNIRQFLQEVLLSYIIRII